MRHEVRRDGDRDRVVEHLGPGREEGPELVERVAGEARRPTRLGVHRGGLGVGGGREEEDEAGDDEHHRGEAQGEARHQPEGVVDRGPDVAVGGREERVDAQDALEPVEAALDPALPFTAKEPRGRYRPLRLICSSLTVTAAASVMYHLIAVRPPRWKTGCESRRSISRSVGGRTVTSLVKLSSFVEL